MDRKGKQSFVYKVNEGSNDVEILAVVHGAREIKTVFHEEWEL